MAVKSLIDVLYKEAMEKEALSSWKANFGNLSAEGIKKLEESGVLNRPKELKGLNIGTNRILQKSNAKNIRNPEHAVSMAVESAKDLAPAGVINAENTPMVRDHFRSMGMFSSPLPVRNTRLNGFTSVPKHTSKSINSQIGKIKEDYEKYDLGDTSGFPSKIPRKDRESKKWADAIFRRHEADEVRYGVRASQDEKNMINSGYVSKLKSKFFSHLSPDIILNESGHTALAPKNAKKYITDLRNFQNDGSEAPFLKENMNFDYGKSPAISNKQRKSINKQYGDFVDNILKEYGTNIN